jgi:hypothetical protein
VVQAPKGEAHEEPTVLFEDGYLSLTTLDVGDKSAFLSDGKGTCVCVVTVAVRLANGFKGVSPSGRAKDVGQPGSNHIWLSLRNIMTLDIVHEVKST